MSEPESPLLTPREWCERVLVALRQRKRAGQDLAYMEMMLTYFIDLNPPHEEFGELLARYIAGAGGGLAGAADLLQQSWRRGESAPPPPLPETLRTLGGLLDDAGAPLARLTVGPEMVVFQVLSLARERTLGATELRQEIAARSALRGQLPSVADVRYERLLRQIGEALAAQPAQSYELYVTPRAVVVEGSAGYFAVFTRDQLTGADAALPHAARPIQGE